jgi:predicted nucleotidyltransferase
LSKEARDSRGKGKLMSTLVHSDNEVFHKVLGETLVALDHSPVRYLLMGGVAATALGGRRCTHDIDVFVKPEDADAAIESLAANGFTTEKTDPRWLYKGFKENVMVDLIFRSSGPICLDDEMLKHSATVQFDGRSVRTLGPEDLFVVKALVLNEHSLGLDDHCMRHLNDLLDLIRIHEMDWDYLIRRSRISPRRVLSLLLYAQSLDLLVPDRIIKILTARLEIC